MAADRHAGRPLVILLCPMPGAPEAAPALAAFARSAADLEALGALPLVVTGGRPLENQGLAARLGLACPVLSDPDFRLGRACGLPAPGTFGVAPAWATLVTGPDRRLLQVFHSGRDGPCHLEAARALLQRGAQVADAGPAAWADFAPVLVLPRLLEPELCERLIACWESRWHSGAGFQGGVANSRRGGNVVEQAVKRRRDVPLPDRGAEAQACFELFRRRLFPEVRKAFQFRITRCETLRLGCYAAVEGGCFKAHRDDSTLQSAHRRFALSLNLNDGYEGGQLVFPEYGQRLYAPPAGGGVVFSCSLLHEARPVTSGKRFGLFGFFFGEAEEAQRRLRDAKLQATRIDGA